MIAYVDLVLTWILFLALFPASALWFYRAYRIGVKKDYSLVGMKRGVPTAFPEKFALAEVILHTVVASLLLFTIYGVLVEGWAYNTWTTLAGSTIWCKILFSFVMSRHAHPPVKKGAKKS